MFAFLVELVILIAALLCVHQEQRPWVFLSGVIVIITPVWILLPATGIFVISFGVRQGMRSRHRERLARTALDRQLTSAEWQDWKSL